MFEPTRAAGLHRLARFVPLAGRAYASGRNHDRGGAHPNVSGLSPYIRHRLVTETEVLQAVAARHSPQTAEKFIQEVYWRGYWKGWLERRPSVWAAYRDGLHAALDHASQDTGLAARIAKAEAGQTGIACFDHWARELVETGYLHNHARMWAASIWIFTLRLPWEVGADWFLRHLLDGDPASNTLGWRWVAGLQTPGKHYVARAENIARYTDGRFAPHGELDEAPEPLRGPPAPACGPVPEGDRIDLERRTGVLLTEEDLAPADIFRTIGAAHASATLVSVDGRSPRGTAEPVRTFTSRAVADATARWSKRLGRRGPDATSAGEIAEWAASEGLEQLLTPYAPVGPAAAALEDLSRQLSGRGISLVRVLRPEDHAMWRHATHGFFRFKTQIPDLLDAQLQTAHLFD